ncbi:MAG TPA: hypothetical protein VMX97_04120 [Hyphomicrobiaceae bacterium]|nr:hypothetical protein [Hyphomicrobiaceae bacterium]
MLYSRFNCITPFVCRLLACGSVLAGGLLAGTAAVAQSGGASLTVVFDGSGSMWGEMPGAARPKFEVVREALREELAGGKAGSKTGLGLVTFGLQGRGGCEAADVAVPVTNTSPDVLLKPLDGFNPQGRGPVVLGLERAVEALAQAARPGGAGGQPPSSQSILLIHDSPDNCERDVCEAAKAIAASKTGVRVHVLSLLPKAGDAGSMSCLTKATGGTLIEASDAASTIAAIKRLVALSVVSGARAAIDDRKPVPDAKPIIPPRPAKALPPTPGLELSVTLTEGGAPVPEGLMWRVNRVGGGSAVTTLEAQPSLALPPGRYQVAVHAGPLVERREVDVRPGSRTPLAVNLNAGQVTLSALMSANGPRYSDALFEIMAAADTQAGGATNDKPVWLGTSPAVPILLKAGAYKVRVTAGQVESEKSIIVATGSTMDVSIPLNAGVLAVRAQVAGDAGGKDIVFTVRADDPSQPSGRRIVARSAAPAPEFLVRAGTYYLSAELGQASGHPSAQKLVAVSPGVRVEERLALRLMELRIESRLANAQAAVSLPVHYKVWRIGRTLEPIVRTPDAKPVLRLTAGRYRIESLLGQHNAIMLRDFEVSTAGAGELVLEHTAGTIQLSLKPGPATSQAGRPGQTARAHGDRFWRMIDASGRTVLRSTEVSPRAILLEGAYTVTVDAGGQQFRQNIVVKSGQHASIVIGAQ